jgi:hypothetical protein
MLTRVLFALAAGLAGPLDEIALLGGCTVESYPEDVTERIVSASFLYNCRFSMSIWLACHV